MSQTLGKLCRNGLQFIETPGLRYRWKQISKGKDLRVAKSLAQKLQEWNAKDESIHYKVDIGYALPVADRKVQLAERLENRRKMKSDINVQIAAKYKRLEVSLDDIENVWENTSGPNQIQQAAEYYGIFDDLFENGYFSPVKPLKINFTYFLDEEYVSPVYRGNFLKPYEAASAPQVSYEAKEDELYTLVLTTPDCHLSEEKGEYLHWLVGNIPGNQVAKGQELCDYLQPFPPRGAGYCRYIFVLYKQEKMLDLSKFARKTPCTNLAERTFSTYDFYRELQDDVTPIGLGFFQSDWDQTLTRFFHDTLGMKEPSFEYDYDEVVLKPQEWFPTNQPFNLYMDKYKERKQLQKELLLEKLKETHPFRPPPPPEKYPLAFPINARYPDWLKDDIRRRRMREGKWKYM
jgi:large subunit ribosomal protein L38